MIDIHLTRLRARDDISSEEEAAIREAIGECKTYSADHVAIPAGVETTNSTMLLDGVMCRFKDLSNGKRQITQLHVAGDFVDLHGFSLKRLDHSIMTLTPCRVALVPHANLTRITERHPHLTRVYWFLTNLDAALHREWELSLGQRSAVARAAALFCELQIRLEIVGLADARGYDLAITQAELGDCLGLTSVHVNRTLRDLRERGLMDFRSGRVSIGDLAGLKAVADFDPTYLYLARRER